MLSEPEAAGELAPRVAGFNNNNCISRKQTEPDAGLMALNFDILLDKETENLCKIWL